MSWFSSTQSIPLDDKIIEATSESIPNGEIDLIKALEISDLIRSKQTAPKDAMRSLKKRFMSSKNPNVQKSCLKLIDFCIKNGGEHFVVEISSKEFLDPLVVLLHSNSLNEEVKSLSLELIQNWSLLFSKNPKLSYITSVYDKLSQENFKFPSIYGAEFNESFLESKVAAEWVDSDACMICSDLFTMLNRKHHCRACGGTFCGKHSSKSLPLPEFGITIPVRVCDNCYDQRKSKQSTHKSHHSRHSKSKSKHATAVNDEDEDLRRAIELSLKESGMPSSLASAPSTSGPSSVPQPIDANETDDDDEDMKRAMEASLRDLKVSEAKSDAEENPYASILPQSSGTNGHVQSYATPAAHQIQPPTQNNFNNSNVNGNTLPGDGITVTEQDNINLFANLLERYKNSDENNIYQDDQIQTLHNNLNTLRPKLNKAINDDATKYDAFTDMHSKIGTIMRLYDGVLQAHMTSLYENKQRQQEMNQYANYSNQSIPQNNYQQQQLPESYYAPQQQQQQQQQSPYYYYNHQQQPAVDTPSYPPSAVSVNDSYPQAVPQSPAYNKTPAGQGGYPTTDPEPQPFSPSSDARSQVQSPLNQSAAQLASAAYPPASVSSVVSPQISHASPHQSFEIPSYPPVSQAQSYYSPQQPSQPEAQHETPVEKKFDFPGVPAYPPFEEAKKEPEEKKEEAPLIEL